MLQVLQKVSVETRAGVTRRRNSSLQLRKYVDSSLCLHSSQIMAAPTPQHAENVSLSQKA